jgi:UrcA family protein
MIADAREFIMRAHLILTSAFLGCSLAQPALAEPVSAQTVIISDLDFSSQQDLAILDARLTQAARSVCGAKSVGDHVGNDRIDTCRGEALARARRHATQLASRSMKTVRVASRD